MSTFEETMQKLSEPSKSGFQAQMELYTGKSAVPEEEERTTLFRLLHQSLAT